MILSAQNYYKQILKRNLYKAHVLRAFGNSYDSQSDQSNTIFSASTKSATKISGDWWGLGVRGGGKDIGELGGLGGQDYQLRAAKKEIVHACWNKNRAIRAAPAAQLSGTALEIPGGPGGGYRESHWGPGGTSSTGKFQGVEEVPRGTEGGPIGTGNSKRSR